MIELAPNEPTNYFQLAKIYEDSGEYQLAEETYLKGRDARPNDPTVYMTVAGYYNRQGDFEKLVENLKKRIELEPQNPEAHYTLATYHWDKASRDFRLSDAQKRELVLTGLEAVDKALSIKPDYLEALVNRGLAHSQKGKHEQAIADFTEALRVDPRDEFLYYNRGNAHYCKGEFDRAIADYSEALRLNPRSLWSLGNRGKSWLLKGEYVRAITDFSRLLQLDPGNLKALCDRAGAHLDLGHPDVVDLLWGQIGRRVGTHLERVVGVAVREVPGGNGLAGTRDVGVLQVGQQLLVGGRDRVAIDRGCLVAVGDGLEALGVHRGLDADDGDRRAVAGQVGGAGAYFGEDVGGIAPFYFSFMGGVRQPQKIAKELAPAIAHELKQTDADLALLVPY